MKILSFLSLLSIFSNGLAEADLELRSNEAKNEGSDTSRQLMDSLDPFQSFFEAQYTTNGGSVDLGLAAQALALTYNRLLQTRFNDRFQRLMGRTEVIIADTDQRPTEAFAFIRAEGFCALCPSDFRFTDQVSGRRDLATNSDGRSDYGYEDSSDPECEEVPRRTGVPTIEELRVAYIEELKRLRTNIIDVPFLDEVDGPAGEEKPQPSDPAPSRPKPQEPAEPAKGSKSYKDAGKGGKGSKSYKDAGKSSRSKGKGSKGSSSKSKGKGSKRRNTAMVESNPAMVERNTAVIRRRPRTSGKGSKGKGSKSGKGLKLGNGLLGIGSQPDVIVDAEMGGPRPNEDQCPEVPERTDFSGEFTSYFNTVFELGEDSMMGVEEAVSALKIAYNRVSAARESEVCMLDAFLFDPSTGRRLSFEEAELRRQLRFSFRFNVEVIGFCRGCPRQFTFTDQVSGRRQLSEDCPQPWLPSPDDVRVEYNLVLNALQINVQRSVELQEIGRPQNA